MNPNTGELVTNELLEKLEPEKKQGFVPVPSELNRGARRKLAGRESATVSLTSGGKLSKFAAEQRKAKRKAAKAGRRASRK